MVTCPTVGAHCPHTPSIQAVLSTHPCKYVQTPVVFNLRSNFNGTVSNVGCIVLAYFLWLFSFCFFFWPDSQHLSFVKCQRHCFMHCPSGVTTVKEYYYLTYVDPYIVSSSSMPRSGKQRIVDDSLKSSKYLK